MTGILNTLVGFVSTGAELPPTVIGQAYGGGYYAGQISTTANGVATHYLVIAPKSSGENTSRQWKTSNTDTPSTGSSFNGSDNTAAMMADNPNAHPAGKFCDDLTIGGYSDWYLPAFLEFNILFFNLKPGTGNNATNTGANAYAVPQRNSNFAQQNPAQTTVVDFKSGGSQAFQGNVSYWTSTQQQPLYGWRFDIINGQANPDTKTFSKWVRAIRKVPV